MYTLPENKRIIQKGSKVPPRGWRPLREPIKFKFEEKTAEQNLPLVNEMQMFQPHISVPEPFRQMAERRMISNQLEIEQRRREEFFKSIVGKIDKLEMPSEPEIQKIDPISVHCEPVPREPSDVFMVKSIDPQQINIDENAVTMRVIKGDKGSE